MHHIGIAVSRIRSSGVTGQQSGNIADRTASNTGQAQTGIFAPPPAVRPPSVGGPVIPAMRRMHSPSRVVQLRVHLLPDVRATSACFLSIESAILRGRAQVLVIGPVPTFFHGGAPQGAALPGPSCRA
ncbi:hypothetical protein Bxe_B1069 [Paraburkholderia xenovorans LB400]|uniref:Uncharacterized protein n=1 Tax=Paraburkholderia xenovorans (strain LB400) TaxID=266265 RepID=Q13M03_PARXL|nr:hypothetical protein Bxe_B1069 [Paraburkholderia xenovorans LB400]